MAAEASTTMLASSAPVADKPLRQEAAQRPASGTLRGLLLTMAVGVFLASCGFALGRASRPGAMVVYLAGQLLVSLAPVLYLATRRSIAKSSGFWISSSIGIASFLIAQCYSPLQFRFEDEFQHAWTLQSILSTHHLFGYNPALPISPQYPGMEIATSAIMSLTHLSIYASATIIAGLSHLLMTVLIFYLGTELELSPRTAAFAVVIFSIGIDYQFFFSYFVYETFAIPFLLATLIVTLKMLKTDREETATFLGIAAVCLGFVTIVSHHVTSYFMATLLIALFVWTVFSAQGSRSIRRLAAIVLPIAVLLAVWDLAIATDTVNYLSQIRVDLFGSTSGSGLPAGGASLQVGNYIDRGHAVASQVSPASWRFLADISAAILAILIPAGAWRIWRARQHSSIFLWPALLVCALYYILVPIYLFTPGADQIVGRSQGLILIPVGLVTAVALDSVTTPFLVPRHRVRRTWAARFRMTVLVGVALVIAVGGIVTSWPPYSAKLPGPYQIAAFERSTDERTIATGSWIAQRLGPGKRIAADHRESLVLSAIGGATAPPGTTSLFENESFRTVDAAIVRKLGIQYVIADYRMTQQLPAEGAYFEFDPLAGHYANPLPLAALSKFDAISGVSRIFDDGVIVIYALQGSLYDR
jgi:hypothetical protein